MTEEDLLSVIESIRNAAEIMTRIRNRECSVSMSNIEYYEEEYKYLKSKGFFLSRKDIQEMALKEFKKIRDCKK